MANARPDLDELLEHADWMRRLSRLLVRDESLADDLVQDTWLAALRSPPRAGEPPRPWLAEVLRNALRMRRRGEGRQRRREEAAESPASSDDGTRLVEALEAQRRLAEALLRLPEPWRSTLLSHYYDGLSASEIAARQKVPAATVRGRLKDGRERLRAALDRAQGGRSAWLGAFTLLADRPAAAGKLAGGLKGALLMKIGLPSGIALAVVGGALALWHESHAKVAAAAAATAAETARASQPRAAGATTPARPPGKLSRAERAEMLRKLAALHLGPDKRPGPAPAARAVAPPPTVPASDEGDLDPEYIRRQMEGILPLVQECFEAAVVRLPDLTGKVMIDFTIVGDPSVGGLVGDSQVNRDQSDITDHDLGECIQETMYALQLQPPKNGGEVKVSFPFVLRAGAPDRDESQPAPPR